MNKKLIAAAIAAAVAAPTAALANDVTIYGVIHASIDYRTDDWSGRGQLWDYSYRNPLAGSWGDSLSYSDNGQLDGFDIASRASRIGFKGTEDLANGLKAIWKIEVQADIADRGGSCYGSTYYPANGSGSIGSPTVNQGTTGSPPNAYAMAAAWRKFDNSDTDANFAGLVSAAAGTNPACDSGNWWAARNAYIGLAGGWGTFLVGRHDTPYKMTSQKLDLFADTLADWNSTVGFVDIRTNSAIAYVSPTWAGFSVAGALVAPHVYGGVPGTSSAVDADSLAEAWSVAATYDANGFFGTVAYESISADWIEAWTGLGNVGLADNTKTRVGLGWTGMGFTIGGVYEWEDDMIGFAPGANGERWQLQAGYTFGNFMLKGMYGQSDYSTSYTIYDSSGPVHNRDKMEGDLSTWAIGVDYNLSKRTKAYMLYTNTDYSNDYTGQEASNFGDGFYDGAYNGSWYNYSRASLDGSAGGWSLGLIHNF